MADREMTVAKRKRLIKTYGPCPSGWTNDDLEGVLDVVYGLYAYITTATELRGITVSNPFDHAEKPRLIRVIDLTEWLESLLYS